MNSCWQVLRTYAGRWRFWIFGAVYLWFVLSIPPKRPRGEDFLIGSYVVLSGTFTTMLCCLMALHLRRLLSGSSACVVPRFAVPHLAVGGAIAFMVWLVLPWLMAAWAGRNALHLVSVHALAGVMFALVLAWPRAIYLLLALPGLLVSVNLAPMLHSEQGRMLANLARSYLEGEMPQASLFTVFLAVAAFPLSAGWWLFTSDRAATFNDDLSIEPREAKAGRFKNAWLGLRDAAIEWRLGRLNAPRKRRIARWRVPGTASWSEMAAIVAGIVALGCLIRVTTREPAGPYVLGAASAIVLQCLPLGTWRFRCMALGGELMRPVTRTAFVGEFLTAMAIDWLQWTCVASCVVALGYTWVIIEDPKPFSVALVVHLASTWCLAVLLFGVAVLTLRLRYWLPAFLGLAFASVLGIWYLAFFAEKFAQHFYHQTIGPIGLGIVLASFAALGLAYVLVTYRRWLELDVAG